MVAPSENVKLELAKVFKLVVSVCPPFSNFVAPSANLALPSAAVPIPVLSDPILENKAVVYVLVTFSATDCFIFVIAVSLIFPAIKL